MFGVQFSFSSQIGKQLTASDVLHEEVQVAAVLGESLQAHLYNIVRRAEIKYLPRKDGQCQREWYSQRCSDQLDGA